MRLSSSGPVNVEVWDDTGGALLTRRTLPDTHGTETVVLPVAATTPYRAHQFAARGPFQAHFINPPAGQRIELRIWSPGGSRVTVYSATLRGPGPGPLTQRPPGMASPRGWGFPLAPLTHRPLRPHQHQHRSSPDPARSHISRIRRSS